MPANKYQEEGGEDLPLRDQPFNRNLHSVQFHYERKDVKGEGKQLHHLTAFDPETPTKPLGVLYWHPKTGEIKGVGVQPEAQGKGVATALWHRANYESDRTRVSEPMKGQRTLFDPKPYTSRSRIVPPVHSNIRTGQGDSWARSVGGYLPPRPALSTMLRQQMGL